LGKKISKAEEAKNNRYIWLNV